MPSVAHSHSDDTPNMSQRKLSSNDGQCLNGAEGSSQLVIILVHTSSASLEMEREQMKHQEVGDP